LRSTFLLLLLLPVASAAGFLFGRETADRPPRAESDRVFVARAGHVVRAPAAATRCTAGQEGGTPNLFCTRIPRGRHQVVCTADTVFVWQVGEPDNPAFVARWKP
jgi:hypothetical protein